MKTFVILLIALGWGAALRAESLATVDGVTYGHITLQRAEPDGLYIEYTPAGGGMGVAKVKFSRLSADLQKQFGYDPAKAGEYEAQCAKANAACREQAIQWEAAARAARVAQQAQDLEEEKARNQFTLAMAQLQATPAGNNGAGYSGVYWGGGYYATAIPAFNGSRHFFHDHFKTMPRPTQRGFMHHQASGLR